MNLNAKDFKKRMRDPQFRQVIKEVLQERLNHQGIKNPQGYPVARYAFLKKDEIDTCKFVRKVELPKRHIKGGELRGKQNVWVRVWFDDKKRKGHRKYKRHRHLKRLTKEAA